jgi:hypothetical protein
MDSVKYPSVIRPFESIVFGVPALLISALSVFEISKYGPTMPTGATPLLIAVSALFVACYIATIVIRAAYVNQFDFMTSDGVLFCLKDAKTGVKCDVDPLSASHAVSEVISAYEPYVRAPQSMVRSDYVYVFMHFGLIDEPTLFGPSLKAGYTVASGNVVHVSFLQENQPLSGTALSHELGHVILGRAWNDWDCSKHHKFMEEHNLQ